jgi:periplasmic protein TonB
MMDWGEAMFEDSLMESGNRIKRRNKFWSFVAFLLNAGALLALVVWPLLHPEALPRQMMATLMVAPSPPPAPPPAAPAPKARMKSELLSKELQVPSTIPKETRQLNEAAIPQSVVSLTDMGDLSSGIPGGIGAIIDSVGTGQPDRVKQKAPISLNVPSGVIAGNLLAKTLPQYPAIAKAAHIQGAVVLQATISKSGSIQNLRVISGPPMLQQAAMDAVRSWRYKPYLLNGEPVEVETTINVVFNLGE